MCARSHNLSAIAGATVPLLRYAPLTWQSSIQRPFSLWTIFANQYAWWIRDEAKTYFVFQNQKNVHFVATIHLKFIGFNAINFLKSENIFVLTETLRYHKQLSTSIIAVGDVIIGKSFDKLVTARGVKVSTKRWRGGSQTQRYGGSGTGYFSNRLMQID